MDKVEARNIIRDRLSEYRKMSYLSLAGKIDSQEHFDTTGSSGTIYQLEFQFIWDDKPHGNIRVIGSIDDAKWRAFRPLSEDFIMAPDGSFVGEGDGQYF